MVLCTDLLIQLAAPNDLESLPLMAVFQKKNDKSN